MTDVVHVFPFCGFERLPFDREGEVEKKRSQSTRNDWQSDDIIECSKTLQIEAY